MAARLWRVGMVVPDYSDACSFYRSYGPWNRLTKTHAVEVVPLEKACWVELSGLDVVYIARPYAAVHADFAELAKLNEIPVWVDFDDLLTGVPDSNPAYKYYGTETAHKSIYRAIAASSVITCTTPYLLERLNSVPGNRYAYVVPNACPLAYERPLRTRHEKSFRIGWRGSRTHDEDLYSYLEVFDSLLSYDNKLKFSFFGEPFWMVRRLLPKDRAEYIPTQDPIDYFLSLERARLDVLMVPLFDNHFNRSKSNIAYIEATMAGANVVGPHFDEWIGSRGCATAESPAEMALLIKDVYRSPKQSDENYAKAHQYILQNLTLDHVNKKRWEILSNLLK